VSSPGRAGRLDRHVPSSPARAGYTRRHQAETPPECRECVSSMPAARYTHTRNQLDRRPPGPAKLAEPARLRPQLSLEIAFLIHIHFRQLRDCVSRSPSVHNMYSWPRRPCWATLSWAGRAPIFPVDHSATGKISSYLHPLASRSMPRHRARRIGVQRRSLA
jgi:hypothetical protein